MISCGSVGESMRSRAGLIERIMAVWKTQDELEAFDI